MPLGFKRLTYDKYLKSRGFKRSDYKNYIIGRTEEDRKLKGYIIIGITENSSLRGYLSRLTWNKEQEKRFEERCGFKKPKYMNSDASFSKLIGGVDDIDFLTRTLIIVEGFFDKFNLDKKLKLEEQHEIKCCFMFGKKISKSQIEKLRTKKQLKNIILIQDPDAVEESKNYSLLLQKYFNVKVGFIEGEKDVGEMGLKEIIRIMRNLKNPEYFKRTKIQKRKLL